MKIKTFTTSDYHLCIVLCSLGFRLFLIGRIDPKRCVFNFDDSSELQKAIGDFYHGDLRIEPKTLLSNAKFVKDRIFGGY